VICRGKEFQLLGENTQKTRETKEDLTQRGTAKENIAIELMNQAPSQLLTTAKNLLILEFC